MLGSHRCFPVLGCNLDLPLGFGNAKRAIRINYCNYKDVSTGRFQALQLSEKQSDQWGTNNRDEIPRHLKYLEFQCLAIWLQGWSNKSDFNLIPVNLGAIFCGTMGILQALFHGAAQCGCGCTGWGSRSCNSVIGLFPALSNSVDFQPVPGVCGSPVPSSGSEPGPPKLLWL